MANKNNKVVLRELDEDDPIYQSGFILSPILLSQQLIRTTVLESIEPKQSRKEKLKQIVNILLKQGWRLRDN